MVRAENTDRGFDLIEAILDIVVELMPEVTPEKKTEIKQIMRTRYGGLRPNRIAKRQPHPTPEQRDKIVREALSETLADLSTDQIAESNGIHRATLYRYLKRRDR